MIEPPQKHTLETLMAAALLGDQRAYGRLLEQLAVLLRRNISGQLKPQDKEDVVQDILLSLHKARHTYEPDRPLLPWVMAIARYRLHDHWRTHFRHNDHNKLDIQDLSDNFGQDVTCRLEWSEDIRRGVESLPAKQRAILQHMYGEDLSVQEVAVKMGMNVSAVKVAAHRAYKLLRRRLEGA